MTEGGECCVRMGQLQQLQPRDQGREGPVPGPAGSRPGDLDPNSPRAGGRAGREGPRYLSVWGGRGGAAGTHPLGWKMPPSGLEGGKAKKEVSEGRSRKERERDMGRVPSWPEASVSQVYLRCC